MDHLQGPQAFPAIPIIVQPKGQIKEPKSERVWNPYFEPYYLILPCHHIVPQTHAMLEWLKGRKCPVCGDYVQDAHTYMPAMLEIQKAQHNIQIMKASHNVPHWAAAHNPLHNVDQAHIRLHRGGLDPQVQPAHTIV